MKFLLAFLLMLPAVAQQADQAKPGQPAKPDQASASDQKADQAPAKAEDKTAAPAPAPAGNEWISGSVDFGYRWRTDVRGSFQEYRSVVDLGEGPKLFGLDFTIQDPKKRLFDRLDAQAYGWGGEPYSTARLSMRKLGVYDLTADYRNIAYFNAVPSFANPRAPAGFDERSFDIHRRIGNFRLDLLPGRRIVPYLAFERNSGYGHGIETWVQSANDEFAIPDVNRDSTNNYRGGLRFELNRFHLTLEQGGTTYKSDDQAFWNGTNYGDSTSPILGQTQALTGLVQAYGVRGTGVYEKALFTARAANWIDVYAQFLFSQPKTDVRYTDLAYGRFVDVSSLLTYLGQSDLVTGTANAPHSSGGAGFELRPLRRVRVLENWMTDRYHDAASSFVAQQLMLGGTSNQNLPGALAYGQFVNYNQNQTDLLVDVTSKITLRGGFRYVWGGATVLAGELSQTGSLVSGDLKRKVGLAGVDVRPSQKFSVHLEYEGSSSDRVYFRTSLNDYHRARARAKYQATGSLLIQANFYVLDNQNPAPDIRFDYRARSNSIGFYWTPAGGKRIGITGEYDRATIASDIQYLGLFLAPGISSYRDRTHTATGAIDLALPGLSGAKLSAGGSLLISSGSRPTRYYQPLARLSLPIQKHVYWNTEWRYYGLGEQFYLYEGFRTHIFQTGLRVTR